MINRHLVIYNLETNLDSQVLASAHDWIQEFSRRYSRVYVFTTHVGRLNLPDNVFVVETGGGSLTKRFLALYRLMKSILTIYQDRKKTDVFHHMSSKTLLLLGAPIKIMGVPQVIWYSHSVADLSLRLGARFAGLVVSATKLSVPSLPGIEARPLGHGISMSRLGIDSRLHDQKRKGILSVGRVVSIKRIEEAIYAIAELKSMDPVRIYELTLVGPYDEHSDYTKFLIQEGSAHNVQINLTGAISYENIPALFRKASIVFTGTPKSADKAALEAAMLGCLILTTNKSVQELTGMSKVLPNKESASNLCTQLAWMMSLSESEQLSIRKEVITVSRNLNSLENLVSRLIDCFDELRARSSQKFFSN